jgi:hypothetical protein
LIATMAAEGALRERLGNSMRFAKSCSGRCQRIASI